jgi:hypothetical protein
MRYALPLLAALAGSGGIVIVRTGGRWAGIGARRIALAGAALCWVPLSGLLTCGIESGSAIPFIAGGTSREDYLADRLDSYRALQRTAVVKGVGGYVMNIGDSRTYGIPGRSLAERYVRRTWSWSLARESGTASELRKKLRQYGCEWLVLNHDRPGPHNLAASSYAWDERAKRVWKEFEGRNLRVVSRTEQGRNNGVYTLYRVVGR